MVTPQAYYKNTLAWLAIGTWFRIDLKLSSYYQSEQGTSHKNHYAKTCVGYSFFKQHSGEEHDDGPTTVDLGNLVTAQMFELVNLD